MLYKTIWKKPFLLGILKKNKTKKTPLPTLPRLVFQSTRFIIMHIGLLNIFKLLSVTVQTQKQFYPQAALQEWKRPPGCYLLLGNSIVFCFSLIHFFLLLRHFVCNNII